MPWNLDGNIDEVSFHEIEPYGEVERDNIEGDLLTYLVYRLSLSLCVDQFTEGLPQSSLLIVLSGVLGLTAEGKGYALPRHYTPRLSALIYLQRLLFLRYARD